ncbi:HNH endonuclease [Acetobacter lambici]|uniref:HNH endonuclease n=1 Tax=Acetobacter lambici TaxID=1332824 RepID=A0ABT1F365_9PROT|nr:HNH endonuclease [Acetobacter lambici]MCP1244173.1 HNH endonuclease [Acetobacter lambici]MCP1259667.1 HNH endonuclease [Acetobacter lambici]NHO58163.1 HNH endonuclease [Acetobacter lambici]
MIKIKRNLPPLELDKKTQDDLTEEFKKTGKYVWNTTYIRTVLLHMSHKKCAYCETLIDEESKYMEVEHFYYKDKYQDKVVSWNNLLPSCKRCNVNKGTHDVISDGMIVNPSSDNPKDHIYFYLYRFKPITSCGRTTIETLYLNDTDRLVSVRMKVGEQILDVVSQIREDIESHLLGTKTKYHINKATRALEKLFESCLSTKEYSATAATVLLNDSDYQWIKKELSNLGMWERFEKSEKEADMISL